MGAQKRAGFNKNRLIEIFKLGRSRNKYSEGGGFAAFTRQLSIWSVLDQT